jgi:hypothetical protein
MVYARFKFLILIKHNLVSLKLYVDFKIFIVAAFKTNAMINVVTCSSISLDRAESK